MRLPHGPPRKRFTRQKKLGNDNIWILPEVADVIIRQRSPDCRDNVIRTIGEPQDFIPIEANQRKRVRGNGGSPELGSRQENSVRRS